MARDERLASELAELLRFERLLFDLSSLFVHLPAPRIDSEIENGLRRIVEFLNVDRGVFWEYSLNQPLAAILANARAAKRLLEPARPMLRGLGAGDLEEIVDDVAGDARRATEVVRRLRDLLRKGELWTSPLDVNEAIRDVETFARADALENAVGLDFDLTPDLPPKAADRIQLQQVVLNLIRNGSEAMRDADGRLLVRTAREPANTAPKTFSVRVG